MNFVSGTPTYYGPAPSNFSIAGITLDDKAFTSECFSIGADTGMVSISNTDALDPGTYKLTIACQAGGGAYRFEDIFVVRMVSATPEAIEVSEPTLVIPYAELDGGAGGRVGVDSELFARSGGGFRILHHHQRRRCDI